MKRLHLADFLYFSAKRRKIQPKKEPRKHGFRGKGFILRLFWRAFLPVRSFRSKHRSIFGSGDYRRRNGRAERSRRRGRGRHLDWTRLPGSSRRAGKTTARQRRGFRGRPSFFPKARRHGPVRLLKAKRSLSSCGQNQRRLRISAATVSIWGVWGKRSMGWALCSEKPPASRSFKSRASVSGSQDT